MHTILTVSGWVLLATTSAFAQNPVQSLSKNNAATATNWYTQNLHDPSQSRLASGANDLLVAPSGQTAPLVVGVGGLVGMGEKDTTVPNGIRGQGPAAPTRARW